MINLMIVMVLGGLWHGASLNFMVWGMLHGTYLIVFKLGKKYYERYNLPKIRGSIGVFISIIVTQYFIFLTWIPFRVRDFDQMIYSMEKFILWDFKTEYTIDFILSQHKSTMIVMIIFIVLSIVAYKRKNLARQISELSNSRWLLFLTGVILLILFFSVGNTNDFIYFQF